MKPYTCPKCASDQLSVEVTAWGVFTPERGAEIVEESIHWDERSQMECRNCGHIGTVAQFKNIVDKSKLIKNLREMLASTENTVHERSLRQAMMLLEEK